MAKEKTRQEKINEMTQTEGWKIVKEMLEFKIEEMEEAILSSITKEGNIVSYTLFDVWRGQRGVYKQILEFTEKPTEKKELKDEDLDSYE